ncbi:MAG: magnesium transporter [Thermodesulfobacteriota bacterium]
MYTVELETIQELVAQGNVEELAGLQEQVDLHPADWADFLEQLPQEDLARYIELVGPELGLPIFEFISFEAKKAVLEILPTKVLGRLITLMSPDDRADLVEEVDEAMKERILSLLFQAERQNLLNLLSYPENSAGAYMTTEYALLRMDDTVQDGLEQIRLQAPRKENVYYIYVVDTSFHLVGFISLRRLIMARWGEYIRDLMDKRVISVQVDDDIEEVAEKMRHYDFLAMPVVDSQERLVGLITFDDIYDVIQEEATEDMFYLANLDTDETVQSPLFRSVKLRVPWLMFNLITALFVATTVHQFSDTISQYVALAVMMPVVGLLGGNAGNQSLTVVVRALALGEIDLGQHWKVLLKELAVGLCNGLMIGLVIGSIAYFWYQNIWLAFILVISMTANLIIAGLFGSMIPIILRKMKLDPALGSSIFVTTATDAGGFFIFLGLATLLLHNLLAG